MKKKVDRAGLDLQRSARSRDALARKRQRGERVGTIPYGYRLAPDGRRLEPEPNELATLAQMQTERAAGKSFALIADDLNAEGVPTKQGRQWYAATVRSVLVTANLRVTTSQPASLPGGATA